MARPSCLRVAADGTLFMNSERITPGFGPLAKGASNPGNKRGPCDVARALRVLPERIDYALGKAPHKPMRKEDYDEQGLQNLIDEMVEAREKASTDNVGAKYANVEHLARKTLAQFRDAKRRWPPPEPEPSEEEVIESAISVLKSKGYRVEPPK